MKKVIAVLLVLVVSAGFAFAGEKARDGRFIAYDNGTVLDTKTGLMWAAKDNGGGINWANAKSYCENYRGGGYTDWRMPTQNELAGLYDPKVTAKYDLHLTNLIDFTHAYGWASETRGSEVASFNFQGEGGRGWRPRSFDDGCHRALPVRFGKGIKQSPQAARAGDGLQPLSPPSDPVVVSTFNTAGVQSGTTRSMTINFKTPHWITYINTYHYFNNGKPPGTIALRHEDGTMYGPWKAEGAAGYGNVPNAYWVVRPNIEIRPGIYKVLDSDPSTWSYNSQSKGLGMIEVRGVKLKQSPQAAQQETQPRQKESVVSTPLGKGNPAVSKKRDPACTSDAITMFEIVIDKPEQKSTGYTGGGRK